MDIIPHQLEYLPHHFEAMLNSLERLGAMPINSDNSVLECQSAYICLGKRHTENGIMKINARVEGLKEKVYELSHIMKQYAVSAN